MNTARRVTALWAALGLLMTASLAYAATVPTAQLTGALHWRSVGPYSGGRVTTVAGVSGEPNLFYAAYAGGGVWESDDYGYHWKNLTDKYLKGVTSGSVGALAVAPSNPKIIYIGTGDSAPRNTVMPGHGMYKSTDAGKTWSYIGLGDTHMINWIVVNPNNPEVVYVAALGHLFGPNVERGVFKTTDGGQTWKKVLFVNDETGAITLAMDPQNPQILYASMWQMSREPWGFSSGGPGSGIYKTTDGGAHWQNITHNPGLPTGVFGKVGLAVAPSSPNVVYALVQADYKPGHPGGLFKSVNGGQSWTLMNDSLDITQRAFYYGRVYVDPKDANTIYLPNADVFVSHDSGKKLTALHPPHGDNHAFWINPDNTQILIEGNDGGATVSVNGGKTWSSEDNQPTGQFYHTNLDDQFPFHIYGAQQDRGSNDGPSAVAGGRIPAVWTSVRGGEMTWVVPTPGTPWITYGSGYYSAYWKDNRRTGSITSVSPWPAYKFGLGGKDIKYRFGWWYHPAVFSPNNPHELLYGGNVLFKTTDAGANWSVISPDLTRNDKGKQLRSGGPISKDVTGEEMYDTLSAIAVSPLADGTIWTGSDDGLVYVTTDGGGHWSQVRPPNLPTWSTITSIEASHTEAGAAYMTANRYMWDDFRPYVYKSTDYGKHWTEITNGLPADEYVDAVRQDPDDPNLLLAGTSATVYFSLDNGGHWQPLSLNLPAVRVTDIQIQPAQHAVAISTFGRAFWVLDNLQFLEQLRTAHVDSNAPYLFKPQQTWLVKRSSFSFGGSAIGGENLSAGLTVFYRLPENYNGKTPVKLTFSDAAGNVINSIALPVKPQPSEFGPAPKPKKLQPGMDRFLWNMRYPDAVKVQGVDPKAQMAGDVAVGPEVVPGTYYVQLSYGDQTSAKQPFVVKLTPNLDTTQAQLQQRFNLLMQIHTVLNELGAATNKAIDARNALQQAVAGKRLSESAVRPVLSDLDRDIGGVVDLKIQSSEGALVFPAQLHFWLMQIASDIGLDFVVPTTAQTQVADGYVNEAHASVAHLQSDVARANAVLKR